MSTNHVVAPLRGQLVFSAAEARALARLARTYNLTVHTVIERIVREYLAHGRWRGKSAPQGGLPFSATIRQLEWNVAKAKARLNSAVRKRNLPTPRLRTPKREM